MMSLSVLNQLVLVLNQNYEPLSVCRARRAIVMVLLGKAEVIEEKPIRLRSVSLSFPLPSIVRLSLYIKAPKREIPLTRKNVLRRDGYRCQYCGTREAPLTTDHVIPRSQGGQDRWENLVCACVSCNNMKGNRTPRQADLLLLKKPRKPHRFAYIKFYTAIPDRRWRPYLFLD
jgi:5-methylcytosine-specific restriction endonuclease McrA